MIIYHNILSLLLVQYTHTHTHLSTLHYKGVEEVNSWCRLKLGPFSLSLSVCVCVCVCVAYAQANLSLHWSLMGTMR